MERWPKALLALVRSLSPRAEFAIVIIAAFGVFIVRSTLAIPFASQPTVEGWSGFAELAIEETLIGLLVGCFLAARGWRFSDLGFDQPRLADLGSALGLFASAYLVTYVFWNLLPQPSREHLAFGRLQLANANFDPLLLLVVSVINALYEEVFVCAYVLSAWRGKSMWDAITISALIRLSYHTYQGPLAVITIAPLGIVFAWFYATRGRVWPLVFAHAFADFLYLLAAYSVTEDGS